MRRLGRKTHRGVSLIEALVALMVVAFGMVTLLGLQNSLRRSADLARQRGTALQLAQQDMEMLRAYSVLEKNKATPEAQDFANITSTERTIHADTEGANAAYQLTRQVSAVDDPRLKSIHITVSWPDRTGLTQEVTLDSLIFGADPSLGTALGIPLNDSNGSNGS
ncbi:MAG TPA: prepilin-type N-terminal cleavage/methylation domain-containing protein [Burkholderiaceae bacterium]|jgi:type IV pilus modification protein PilV